MKKYKIYLMTIVAMLMIACQEEEKSIPVTSLTLNESELTLEKGNTAVLVKAIAPFNATEKGVQWESSQPGVVSVDEGLLTALSVGSSTITVTTANGSKKASCAVTVIISVNGITMSDVKLSLALGKTYQLGATVKPEDATQSLKWKSSAENIATVTDKGLVTATGKGTATITVFSENDARKATCEVTVFVPVTSVALSDTTLTLTEGDTKKLTATVLPENANNKVVTWSSSAPGVATVVDGLITAVSPGNAVITVTANDGGFKAICNVTVKKNIIHVTGITLNSTSRALLAGEEATLNYVITPSNAANQDVTWSSSDQSVATVSNGKVTALSTGFSTITVTTVDGGYKAECLLWVQGPEFVVNNILLNPGFVDAGATAQTAANWTQPPDTWFTSFYSTDPLGPGTRRTGSWQRNGQNSWPFSGNYEANYFQSYITNGWAIAISPSMAGALYQDVSVTPGKIYGFSAFIGLCEFNVYSKFKDFETVKILSANDGLTAYHLEPIIIDRNKVFDHKGRPAYVTTVRGFVKIPAGVTRIRFQIDQRSFDTTNPANGSAVGDSPAFAIDNCTFFPIN